MDHWQKVKGGQEKSGEWEENKWRGGRRWGPVALPHLSHGAELDEVAVRVVVLDGVEDVDGAHDVVCLGVDGVLPVDHRVGGRALLPEVDDVVGHELLEGLGEEGPVVDVAHHELHGLPRDAVPRVHAVVRRGDGGECVHAKLGVVLPAHEVVHCGGAGGESLGASQAGGGVRWGRPRTGDERVEAKCSVSLHDGQSLTDADLVAAGSEVKGRGPAAVAVTADDHDARALPADIADLRI